MNFINQIVWFNNYIAINRLSSGQIALYYALINIANSLSEEWFSLCDETLQSRTGLTRSGLIKAKNLLKQKGLIDFIKGDGSKSPKYKIIAIDVDGVQGSVQGSVQGGVQGGVQGSVQGPVSSNERVRVNNNNNIYNNTNNSTTTLNTTTDTVVKNNKGGGGLKCISYYEQNIGVITPKAAEIFTEYIENGIEDELICCAIDEAVRANARNINYIDKIILNCQNECIKTAAAFKHRSAVKRNTDNKSKGGGWEGVKML